MRRLAFCGLMLACLRAAEPVYVALAPASNALVYVSPEGAVEATVQIGQNPRQMAFSPDKRYVYTTGDALAIVDLAARRRIGDVPLGQYRRAYGVAVDPKSGRMAVTTEAPARLLLIDATRRTVLKDFDTKGKGPAMVTFGPAGAWAYVSNTQSGTVSAINVQSGEAKIIQTGDLPLTSVLSADGKELYVLNRQSNNVAIIDTAKQQVIANILTGKGPQSGVLAKDGKTLVYILSQERRVAWADTRLRRQADYVLVPSDPVSCALAGNGEILVSTASGVIYRISISQRKITGEIRIADNLLPTQIAELPVR
jgi:YVTN family beta-propeller protein